MLTAEDKAVLAHVVEDPDAWIAHALATVGHEAVLAKCRRDVHVAAYRKAVLEPDYAPRGPLPSDATCAEVARLKAEAGRLDAATWHKRNGWPEPL